MDWLRTSELRDPPDREFLFSVSASLYPDLGSGEVPNLQMPGQMAPDQEKLKESLCL